MSSSSVECGTHLTTSRINRLLRPLRNKCTNLAALPKPAIASRVTYSKQTLSWELGTLPPLTVLQRAGTRKLTLGRRAADEFELSRRIHAVCDAFRNVVHVAFRVPCSDRIPSLAAMSVFVVGQNMPLANVEGESDEESADERDIVDGIDEIYECVPPHYRRFLIVSHALSIVLRICAQHHTLVNLLLDHCLAFGLVHESTRLLHIVLSQAFLSCNPSCPPPVTHPAHTTYLLDLHAKWTSGGRPSGSSSNPPLFTTSTLSRELLDCLSTCTHPNAHIIWTSKVFHRFLRMVETSDLSSYIAVIHTLSSGFWAISGSSADDVRRVGSSAEVLMLKDQLSEWLSRLFDLLFHQEDPVSSPVALSRIQATIEVLNDSHAARLHELPVSALHSPINLPDLFILFSTHIMVTFPTPIIDPTPLLTILGDIKPQPATFAKLMAYFCRHQATQTFDSFTSTFLSDLRKHSSVLCSQRLFALDASFWACALRHFETSITSLQKNDVVTRYKRELMDAVDSAERRCYGGKLGRPGDNWVWEEMIGSWIQKTPMPRKKRKLDGDDLSPLVRDSRSEHIAAVKMTCAPRSNSVSTPSSSRHKSPSTFLPSSSSQFSEPESSTEDGSEYQDEDDKENCPPLAPSSWKRAPFPRRHSRNFLSLIADAQKERIALHSKPQTEVQPSGPSSVIPKKYNLPPQGPCRASRKQEQKGRSIRQSPPRISRQIGPGPLLSSDDSLDLFAHTTSSPTMC